MLWSGTAIANKVAVAELDGLSVGVFRSLVAGAMALPIARVARLRFPARGSDRLLLTLSGVSSFAVWPVMLSIGIQDTTVAHAALIMAMIPVFTVLISSTVQRRQPPTQWWLGAGIAFSAAVALIASRGVSSQLGAQDGEVIGDLIILCGCLVCSTGYVAGARVSPLIGAVATTFWGLAIALVIVAPVFLSVVTRTNWKALSADTWYDSLG